MVTREGDRVLIVDDEKAVRRSLNRCLTMNGFNCSEAANADEAMEHLRENPAAPGVQTLHQARPPSETHRRHAQAPARRQNPPPFDQRSENFLRRKNFQGEAGQQGGAAAIRQGKLGCVCLHKPHRASAPLFGLG